VSPQPSHVRTIDDLRGPAGRLEALLNTGHKDARFCALVCHPHPAGGGTMHNKVVYHAMKTISSLGIPVLRFNFRGVGLSEGEHAHGPGERDDARAALDWLERTFARPILFAGFSFGAHVGLHACCGDPRVAGLIALGLPVNAAGRSYSYGFLQNCAQPKLFISGDHDQFASIDELESVWSRVAEPRRTRVIPGAEHFFQGTPGSPTPKLAEMQQEIRRWLADTFALESTVSTL